MIAKRLAAQNDAERVKLDEEMQTIKDHYIKLGETPGELHTTTMDQLRHQEENDALKKRRVAELKEETEQGTFDRTEALQASVANLRKLGMDHESVMQAIQELSDVIDT